MKEVKRERSLPVQSRIDMVELANLDLYWIKQGVHMRSLSQLVSWSIDMLCDSLRGAGLLEDRFTTLVDAKRYLNTKGLKQESMDRVGRKKYAFALRSETLRGDGMLPGAGVDVRDYNTVHRATSVEPYDGSGRVNPESAITNDEWDEMQRRIAKEKKKEKQRDLDDAIEYAKNSGMIREESHESVKSEFADISEEEFHQHLAERDKEIIERENAPIDLGDFKIVEE